MEEALAAFAAEALKKKDRAFDRKWAWSWFDWKPGAMQSKAEQAIGERFLNTMDRLGVLQALPGSRLAFTHDVLLELYLGLGGLLSGKPPSIATPGRIDAAPLLTVEGRALVARLALTPAEERRAALRAVARRNLHLAAWSLWGDDDARAEEGEWLASEILRELQWGQPGAARLQLETALTSLGASALAACRALIDERKANLPAHLAAIELLARSGSVEDVPRLRRFLEEPAPGWWEIEQLRQTLRDAEAKIVDPETRSRYTKHEIAEMAKDTAMLIVYIAAAFTAENSERFPVQTAAQLTGMAGEQLIDVNVSDFFRAQQLLRAMVGSLPALIEQRKGEITAMAPRVRAAAESAILALSPNPAAGSTR